MQIIKAAQPGGSHTLKKLKLKLYGGPYHNKKTINKIIVNSIPIMTKRVAHAYVEEANKNGIAEINLPEKQAEKLYEILLENGLIASIE